MALSDETRCVAAWGLNATLKAEMAHSERGRCTNIRMHDWRGQQMLAFLSICMGTILLRSYVQIVQS